LPRADVCADEGRDENGGKDQDDCRGRGAVDEEAEIDAREAREESYGYGDGQHALESVGDQESDGARGDQQADGEDDAYGGEGGNDGERDQGEQAVVEPAGA